MDNQEIIRAMQEHTAALEENTRAMREHAAALRESTEAQKKLEHTLRLIFEDDHGSIVRAADSKLHALRQFADEIQKAARDIRQAALNAGSRGGSRF